MNDLVQEFVQALKDNGVTQIAAVLIAVAVVRLTWKFLDKIDLL